MLCIVCCRSFVNIIALQSTIYYCSNPFVFLNIYAYHHYLASTAQTQGVLVMVRVEIMVQFGLQYH